MPQIIDMPQQKRFEVVNKAETEAEIFLYGAIGDSFWGDSISAKSFSEELKKVASTVKTIHLRINSPGGSVFDGVTIYERLKEHKAKIIVHVDGLAASIASVIAMAGDEIIMGQGAMMMLHKPLVMTYGNSMEHERSIDVLDKIENQMVGIYNRKSKKSRAEIETILAKETWYTAEETVAEGFADTVSAGEDSMRAAACISTQLHSAFWLKNKPEMKTQDAIAKHKLKDFNKYVNSTLEKLKK